MSLMKAILIGLFALMLAIFLCLGLMLACVSSSSCTTRGIELIKAPLADLGLRVQVKELSFVPWRGLKLAELTLSWYKKLTEEESQVEIRLQRLDLSYSLAEILQKRLQIKRFGIEGLQIKGKIFLPADNAEKLEEPEAAAFNLAQFLAEPPIEFDLDELSINGFHLDFAIRMPLSLGSQSQPEKLANAMVHDFQELLLLIPRLDLQTQASLKKNHLSYAIDLNPPLRDQSAEAREPWQISFRQGEQLSLDTKFNMHHQMAGNLLQQEGEVFFSVPRQSHWLGLEDLSIAVQALDDLGQQKSSTSIRLASLELDLNHSLDHLKLPLHGSFSFNDLLPAAANFGQKMQLRDLALQTKIMGENSVPSESLIAVSELNQGLSLQHKIGEPSELKVEWQVGPAKMLAPGLPLTWETVAGNLQVQADALASHQGWMSLDVAIDRIQVPGILLKPASLGMALDGHMQGEELKASYEVNLNQTPIIQGDLQARDRERVAELQIKGRIGIDRKLQQQLPGLEILSQLGDLATAFSLDAGMQHEAAGLAVADLTTWSDMMIRGSYQANIEQLARPQKSPFLLLLREPLEVSGDFQHRAGEIKATSKVETSWLASSDIVLQDLDLALEADYLDPKAGLVVKLSLGSLQLPKLPELRGLEISQKLNATLGPWDLNLEGDFWLSEKKLLQHVLKVQDQAKEVGALWSFQLWPHPELLSPFAPSAPWESLGRLQLDGEIKAGVRHQGADLTKLNPDAITGATVDTKLTITQSEAPALIASQRFLFPVPVQISAQTKLSPLAATDLTASSLPTSKFMQSQLTQALELILPKFHFGDLMQLAGAKVNLEVKVPTLTKPEILKTKLETHVDTLQLPMGKDGAWDLGPALSPIKAKVDVDLVQQKVVLQGLKATLGQILGFATKGQLQLSSKDGRFEGQAVVDPPKSLTVGEETIVGSGRVQFPWVLVVEQGKNLRFEAKSHFSDFSLSAKKLGLKLQGLNGPILIAEDLVYDETQQIIAFATLLQQNPFQRVDFSRYQPLVQDARELTFHRLQAAGVEIGPFRGQLQLTQNMLQVNKFDLNLLSGSASGMMYVNLLPKDLALGLLSRITRIDPAQLNPGVAKKSGSKTISLRTAIELQIPQSMIAGRIDVNEIGSEQILSLLDALDPKGEDEQLNSARQALRLAYPQAVNIEIKQGLMDMLLSMDSAVMAKDIEINRFPVYSFMASALSDLTQSLHEVPIQ